MMNKAKNVSRERLNVTIQHQSSSTEIPSDPDLEGYIIAALSGRIEDAEITLRIVDEAESAALNKQFRKKAGPTNVLAFPYELPEELPFHGDIVVCEPLLKKEAQEQDKTLHAHWAHLVIHGTLHLLGYDHQDDDQANKMETLETELLKQLGFDTPYE